MQVVAQWADWWAMRIPRQRDTRDMTWTLRQPMHIEGAPLLGARGGWRVTRNENRLTAIDAQAAGCRWENAG